MRAAGLPVNYMGITARRSARPRPTYLRGALSAREIGVSVWARALLLGCRAQGKLITQSDELAMRTDEGHMSCKPRR